MDLKFKNREQELIYRVFKSIESNHFYDCKMHPHLCGPVLFDRSVADEIANYVKGNFPRIYFKKRKYYEWKQRKGDKNV